MGVDAARGPEQWAIYVVFGNSCSDTVAMTRSGKITLFLLAGTGVLVALLAALVFLGPRLLNTKAVRGAPPWRSSSSTTRVHLSYARAEVTFFPRPRVVIRGGVLDVPGMAAGTVKTLHVGR